VKTLLSNMLTSTRRIDRKNSWIDFCRFGRIDILVNNAGKQIMCSDFAQINLDDVESTFRSNILAM
jgi:NADP-dependent 3-hydroxy acid dehydrogenase YdfG